MVHICFIFIMIAAISISASIDFYGYRATVLNDTQIQYNQVLLGPTELENTEITVTPKGSYLDIIEDGWISSDITKLNQLNLTGDYLMKGSIPVPGEATVVGLQTWRGNTMYRAGLYQTKYIVDSKFSDSTAFKKSLDSRIALLQKHTDVSYELIMTRVILGEKTHVRIRYLLRMGSSRLTYIIPVLFHSTYAKTPKNIKFKVYADNNFNKYMLISGTSRFILSDTSTNLIPYQTSIALQQENLNASTMNITEFTSGPYTGHYMLINSGVNDSIITKLSKPISTVFIWRWNKSEDMVVFSNQMKSLSGYAQSIIKQAQDLKNIIIELRKLGNHAGLIHCLEDQSEPMYMSKTLNDHNDSLIFDYLNSFTESNLYDKYVNRSSGSVPTWVPSGGSNSLLEQSRNDFLSTIKNAKTLLMNGTGSQYQHIILISAGFPKNNITKNYYREVTDVLNSVTVASENASWYGVDLQNTFSQKGLYQWRGYLFPTFSPVLIQLRINNALQPLSYPLSQNTWGQPFSLSARETALWDSAFVWTGFDGAGVPTVSIEEKPMVYIIHADSGIAKLWADDENHIAEKEDVYPGGTFGILTKATFFQATVDNISDIDQSSIPFLNDDEIHTPRTKTIKKANADIKSTLKIVKGVLNIETEKDFSILKITDLTGKVILSIDLNRYKTGIHTYSIPLSAILQKYGKKKLLGILIGKTTQVLTIDIGGLR